MLYHALSRYFNLDRFNAHKTYINPHKTITDAAGPCSYEMPCVDHAEFILKKAIFHLLSAQQSFLLKAVYHSLKLFAVKHMQIFEAQEADVVRIMVHYWQLLW